MQSRSLKLRIGVDPGKGGALCLYNTETKKVLQCHDMPLEPARAKGKTAISPTGIAEVLSGYAVLGGGVLILENVFSRPGEGVSSSFNFGRSKGLIEQAAACLDLPLVLITPQMWKKHYSLIKTPKSDSIALAVQMFGNEYIKLKKHDGRAEAMLMAALPDDIVLPRIVRS